MTRLADKAKARRARIGSKVTRASSQIVPDLELERDLGPHLRFGKVSLRTLNRQEIDERGVGRREGRAIPQRKR